MRIAPAITLSAEQRVTLEQGARSRSLLARVVERARIVLLIAEGQQDKEVARVMKITVIRRNSGRVRNQQFAHFPQPVRVLSLLPMFHFFRFWLGSLSRCFHSRQSLLLENLALRQQLAILKHRHPRPKLGPLYKLSGRSPASSGPLGSRLSWWSLPRPWSAGIAPAFGCTGV
jgi:hypothetical protein